MNNLRLKMIKEQRLGVLIILCIIFSITIYNNRSYFFSEDVPEDPLSNQIVEEIHLLNSHDNKYDKNKLRLFNPNDYDLKDWQNIGFSKKQAEVIIKYKNSLGGKFTSKEQLKSCVVISDQKYNVLLPYLLFPDKQKNESKNYLSTNKKTPLKKFNPNTFGIKEWMELGFSEKQAESILKYKNSLGGKFTSKEQIKKCYVISENRFEELLPFIRLSENIIENKNGKHSQGFNHKGYTLINFNPNDYTSVDWQNIGFSPKQSEVILKYKNKLGGAFTSKQQIKECFVISEYKFNEIEPYIQL